MYSLFEVTENGDKVLLVKSEDISVIEAHPRHENDIYSVEYFNGIQTMVLS